MVYKAGELSEMYYGLYEENGTNSTAELKALHEAMLMAKQKFEEGLSVQILTDSEYGLKSLTEWAVGWKAKGWKKKKGAISNLSIIKPMYELYCTISDAVSLVHVDLCPDWRCRLHPKSRQACEGCRVHATETFLDKSSCEP